MDVSQIYQVVNDITAEAIGEQAILKEDLSNVVEYGKAVFDNMSMDNFCKKLIDRIGKVVFDTRKYTGFMLPLFRESWEYGSVKELIYTTSLPDATENESWKLTPGASYDPNIFTGSPVAAKFYDHKTTLEVPLSLADIQVKSAFASRDQLNSFMSMLQTNVSNSLEVKQDALAQRTVNSLIAHTLYNEFPSVTGDNYGNSTGVKAINLLKLYNAQFGQTLTFAQAMFSAEFMRYASLIIKNNIAYVKSMSTLFNCGGIPTFTGADKLHLLLLSDFKNGVETYLESDTFHNEFVAMPASASVPYFQGTGTAYSIDALTKIHVDILDPADDTTKCEIEASHILGVMFDHYAAGVANENKRVTSNYNGKAEFTNYWYKVDCNYWNNLNSNCVVFFAA